MGLELFKEQKRQDVFCPHCGAKAQMFLYKPACPNCHWNVRAAKANIVRQVRNASIPFILFAVVAYLAGAGKWGDKFPLLGLLWPVAFGVVTFGREYYKLAALGEAKASMPLQEPPSSFPQMPILGPTGYNRTFLLSLLLESVTVVVTGWMGYSNLPEIIAALKKHQVDFQMYILLAHFIGLGHLILTVPRRLRSILIERKVAAFGQAAAGTVVSERYGAQFGNEIEYEFRDLSGGTQRGKGTDFSKQLYEDMRVMVLFNPADPRESVPICGLVVHKVVT